VAVGSWPGSPPTHLQAVGVVRGGDAEAGELGASGVGAVVEDQLPPATLGRCQVRVRRGQGQAGKVKVRQEGSGVGLWSGRVRVRQGQGQGQG